MVGLQQQGWGTHRTSQFNEGRPHAHDRVQGRDQPSCILEIVAQINVAREEQLRVGSSTEFVGFTWCEVVLETDEADWEVEDRLHLLQLEVVDRSHQ